MYGSQTHHGSCQGESVPKHPDRKYPTGYWGLDSALESRRPLMTI